jgi:hypothetical protein
MTLVSFTNWTFTNHGVYICSHNEYFEYILDDLGYMGEDMFVMHHIERHELVLRIHMDVIKTYDKMHESLTSHFILRFDFWF